MSPTHAAAPNAKSFTRSRTARLLLCMWVTCALLLALPALASANVSGDIDQCQNGSPVLNGCDGPDEWINGNLNDTKATYAEGDSVPYRIRFGDLTPGNSYKITLGWDTTKGGLHALDFITSYGRTSSTAPNQPCVGVFTDCTLANASKIAIPIDPAANSVSLTVPPLAGLTNMGAQDRVNGSDSTDWLCSTYTACDPTGTVDRQFFSMWGGTLTAISGYTIYAGTYAGDSSTSITVTFEAGSTGQAVLAWGGHIAERLDWGALKGAASVDGSPYHMRILSMVSAETPPESFSCCGQQDRSMKTTVVDYPALITVTKETDPASDPQDFPFALSTGFTARDQNNQNTFGPTFALDTDAASTTTSHTVTFKSSAYGSGRTITETEPSGWAPNGTPAQRSQVGDYGCTFQNPLGTARGDSYSTALPDVNFSLDLREADVYNCTYKNKKQSTLRIVKNSNPDDGQSFDFTATGVPTADQSFTLVDDASTDDPDATPNTKVITGVTPGDVTVTESQAGLSNWSVSNISCVRTGTQTAFSGTFKSGGEQGYHATFNGSHNTDADPDNSVKVTLAAGDDVTCTFVNQAAPAKLTIVKDAQPNDDQAFVFTKGGSLSGDVTLVDNGSPAEGTDTTPNSAVVYDGTGFDNKTVAETPVEDWTLSSISCSGDGASRVDYLGATENATAGFQAGDTRISYDARPGDDVTCTFVNQAAPAKLTIVKDASENSETAFSFTKSGALEGSFNLYDDGSTDDPDQTPSSAVAYSGTAYDTKVVTEDGETHWTLTDIECRGTGAIKILGSESQDATDGGYETGDNRVELAARPGDDVTCVFTNTRDKGKITLIKDLQPAGDVGRFDLAITDGENTVGSASNVADHTIGPFDVEHGTYTVGETAHEGTDLGRYDTDIRCVDGGGEGQEVAAKENVTGATRSLNVDVESNQDVVCTITNTGVGPDVGIEKIGPDYAYDGDLIQYRITVSNSTTGPVNDVQLTDHIKVPAGSEADPNGCDKLEKTGGDTSNPGVLDPGETWTYICDYTVRHSDEDASDVVTNVATVQGKDSEDPANTVGPVSAEAPTRILHPGIQVEKSGPATAYHGDTVTYFFRVTNTGDDTPLSDVTLADDKCGTPVLDRKENSDDDDILENPGQDEKTSEVWIYRCTKAIPDHASGENPYVNKVEVNAVDQLDNPVEPDEDDHSLTILHPAIGIDKTGPATGEAGQPVAYNIDVTNPGDVRFAAATVVLNDPRCDGSPALVSKNGDSSPDFLNPGDRWSYTCSASTQVGDTQVVNVATVDASDENGKPVKATDDAVTALEQPQQLVLPDRIVPGAARLLGPTGCRGQAFRVRVAGTKIAQVRFTLDGKRLRTLTKPNFRNQFAVRINPRTLKVGVHRLRAVITFERGSGTRPKTMNLSFQRCARRLAAPRFTG